MTRKCRRCGESFETDRAHRRLCWPCYWELEDERRTQGRQATSPPPPPAAPAPLDVRLLRDAISLCHPDRHPPERFKTANAVTAALIELLNAARRAA
jgi:hypothetical protein